MDQIIDNLYLGDISAAENAPALRKANITHILSVTTRPVAYPERITLEIKRVELEDDPDSDVIPIFPETNAFINGAIKSGGVVLVHCDMGVSRSVTMVAAYMIQTHSHTAETALAHMCTRRAFVRPNSGYTEQLEIYSNTSCNMTEASVQWTKRKAEIARVEGAARSNPFVFITSAVPRIFAWVQRKTKRTSSDEDRHEKMKVFGPDAL